MTMDRESPRFVFSDRTNLADADFNALSREAAGCSRRSKGFVSRCQELMRFLWKLSLQVPTRSSGDTSASLLGGDWSCPF